VVDLLNEIISMETTGLMFKAKSGVEESSVLVTIKEYGMRGQQEIISRLLLCKQL